MDVMADHAAWLDEWLAARRDPELERRFGAAPFPAVSLTEFTNPGLDSAPEPSDSLPDFRSRPVTKFTNPLPLLQEPACWSDFRLKVLSFNRLTNCRRNKKSTAGTAAFRAVQHRTPVSRFDSSEQQPPVASSFVRIFGKLFASCMALKSVEHG